ncbi:hypothetical protein [Ferrimonas kyonanensis]|uniref:hypothetical protein n=1 Tax=Ferrimonas kyonanensis TaxID=364763 RepID=UPI0012EC69A7|nr:hypothetical protein [Ferrimonas kyonanensis]
MTRMLYLALMIFSISSYALDFSEYDPYSFNENYRRGEIVSESNHLWVARLPGRGHPPAKSRFHWVRVDIGHPEPWRSGRFYVLGKVVSFGNQFYLAKGVGFAQPDSGRDCCQWQVFTHPGIGTDLPLVDSDDAKQGLEGIDSNFNGIRDDYEVAVVMESPSEAVRQAGLGAASAYKQMVSMATSADSEVTPVAAAELVDELLTVSACFRSLAGEHQGVSGFQHRYFNTFERMEAYLEAESRLYQALGDDYQPVLVDLPCQQMSPVEE